MYISISVLLCNATSLFKHKLATRFFFVALRMILFKWGGPPSYPTVVVAVVPSLVLLAAVVASIVVLT